MIFGKTYFSTRLTPDLGMGATDDLRAERDFERRGRVCGGGHPTREIGKPPDADAGPLLDDVTDDGLKGEGASAEPLEMGYQTEAAMRR